MQKTFSEKDIPAVAKTVIRRIQKNANKDGATIVALSGDLGAGKTTLTQEIAKQLGIKAKIISPTFVLLKTYKLKTKHWDTLHHIDAYRLEKPEDVHRLEWNSLIQDPKNIVFLEWPEQLAKLVPKNSISIKLAHAEKGKRSIVID